MIAPIKTLNFLFLFTRTYFPSLAYRIVIFITNKLTPWNRIFLKNLIVVQLVKKFPTFYTNLRFIIIFTVAHHWSLS
jgi:hypothetical protein